MPPGRKSRLWYANPKIFEELTVGQIAERFGLCRQRVQNIKRYHRKTKGRLTVIPKEEN